MNKKNLYTLLGVAAVAYLGWMVWKNQTTTKTFVDDKK